MYWEATKFYKEFAGKKCKYGTYLARLWKGMDMKQAIQPRDLHFKWRIDAYGKTCPRCMKYKLIQWYYNSRAEKSWKDSCCMDCRKQQRKDDRWDDVKLARERKYRKGYERRPEVVKRMALDSLFYSNAQVKRNRRIIQQVRKIPLKESRESKLQFLHYNKGISIAELKKHYWDFPNSVIMYSGHE